MKCTLMEVYMGGLQFFMQAAASLSLSEVANAIKFSSPSRDHILLHCFQGETL